VSHQPLSSRHGRRAVTMQKHRHTPLWNTLDFHTWSHSYEPVEFDRFKWKRKWNCRFESWGWENIIVIFIPETDLLNSFDLILDSSIYQIVFELDIYICIALINVLCLEIFLTGSYRRNNTIRSTNDYESNVNDNDNKCFFLGVIANSSGSVLWNTSVKWSVVK
jgi:hypothetical protein